LVRTDETVIVAGKDIRNSQLNMSVGELEVVCKDDWGLQISGPEEDEPVVVCDLMGLAGEVPIEDRMYQQSLKLTYIALRLTK
jgi:hypothetical protein